MSAQQFMELLFGKLPEFFKDEAELRAIWSAPDTRAKLLQGLAEKGFGHDQLAEMQKIIDAEKSDLFDVLAHVAYAMPPVTREVRAANARVYINTQFQRQAAGLPRFRPRSTTSPSAWRNSTRKSSPRCCASNTTTPSPTPSPTSGQPDEIGTVFAGFQKYLFTTQ